MESINTLLSAITLLGIVVWNIWLRHALTSYTSEKSKNIATKQDIAEITTLIETAKADILQKERYSSKRYELKFQACLKALAIIDAYLSHKVKNDNEMRPITPDKQYATAAEIRACDNELLLTLDSHEVVSTFRKIMSPNSENPIIELDILRQLIRKELGFPGETHKDENNSWTAISITNPPAK